MMEARWSAERVARQLSHSDCDVRRGWNQWIRKMSFTQRPGSRRSRQTSRRENRHIVAPSFGNPVSSRIIRRHQAEGHLGTRCKLRVLPLRPHINSSVWCGARHEETGLQWKGSMPCLATNPDSISTVMTIAFVVWRPRGESLNPAFVLQRHTAPTAGVMVWGAIAYNTRSLLVFIHDTISTLRYIHEILQLHVLSLLMPRLPGAIFQQSNARSHALRVSQAGLHTITALNLSARSPDFSPIEHIWDHLGRRGKNPTSLNEIEARSQQI
ncbi:transposable element Tcb2 transposase [Trichonephila clavipes]|nr:transposable element Tcb2 transposase [Trichonephila clavipes]